MKGGGALAANLSKKVMGSCFRAQGAASTHRSPHSSHSVVEMAQESGPPGRVPPVDRDVVAAACAQPGNSGRRLRFRLKMATSLQHQQPWLGPIS